MSDHLLVMPLLSEGALARLRHRLRDCLRRAGAATPMGHVAEALAASLGSATHAALLARLAADGKARDVPMDTRALSARLAALGAGPAEAIPPAARRFVALSLLDGSLEPAERAPRGGGDLPPPDWTRRGRDRMISTSKSGYVSRFPGNLVAFNAHACTASSGRVWSGDLDVTRDAPHLQRLADGLGEEVHVLRESALGPEPDRPDLGRAIATFRPGGT